MLFFVCLALCFSLQLAMYFSFLLLQGYMSPCRTINHSQMTPHVGTIHFLFLNSVYDFGAP